jgi:uncharacterized membrane protein YqjE
MPSQASNQAAHDTNTSSEDTERSPDLAEEVRGLERELRAIVHDYVRLAALETRRAGESLVKIVAMGSVVAVMVCTAWLLAAGWAGIVLVENNVLNRGGALLAIAAANVLIALVVIVAIRRESRHLLMSATVHFLKPTDRGKEG